MFSRKSGFRASWLLAGLVWVVFRWDVPAADALPTPAVHYGVPPSFTYRTSVEPVLGTGGTEDYEIELEEGHVLSVLATPGDPTLRLSVDLTGPGGAMGSGSAAVAGEPALLQATAVTAAGTHTVSVTAEEGTGAVSVEVWINAAVETPGENGALATAQDLESAAVSTGSGEHLAVVGGLAAGGDSDWFGVSGVAGEPMSFALGTESEDEAFSESVEIDTDGACIGLTAVDFDGIHGRDLAVILSWGGGGEGRGGQRDMGMLAVYTSDGEGGFDLAFSETLSYAPTRIATGYLDDDALEDVAIGYRNDDDWPPTGGVWVFLNDGFGHLVEERDFPVGGPPAGLAVADVDGENGDDLAVTFSTEPSPARGGERQGESEGVIAMALRTEDSGELGDLEEERPGIVAAGDLAVADMNGDGCLDLVFGDGWNGEGGVLLWVFGHGRCGEGGFQRTIFPGNKPQNVATGDLNGDGHTDAVVSSRFSATDESVAALAILIGDGSGALQLLEVKELGGATLGGVEIMDVTGDGIQDILVCETGDPFDWWGSQILLFIGSGGARFLPPRPIGTGPGPDAPVVADLDGNGSKDLAVANTGERDWDPASSFSVSFNQSPTTLRLYDESGAQVAMARDETGEYDDVIHGFLPPADGTYFAEISGGDDEVPYCLTVTRGVNMELARAPGDCVTSGSAEETLGALRRASGSDLIADVTESFEDGGLSGDWTTYSSDTDGRIEVTDARGAADGEHALFMDNDGPFKGVLNEAVWTVDLADTAAAVLTFQHLQYNKYPAGFDGPFADHHNADGVAISTNGTDWYPVWSPEQEVPTDEWLSATVDLGAAADDAGISLTDTTRIKFQQYGYRDISSDGCGWDAIEIFTSGDCYSLDITAGDSVTVSITLPGGDPGQPPNTLQPQIVVLDPSGSEIARDTELDMTESFAVVETGIHRIRVLGLSGAGVYLLHVTGVTPPEPPPLLVTGVDPADGASELSFPSEIEIQFSAPVLLSTVEAGDLEVDGAGAGGVTVVDAARARFDVSGLGSGPGTYAVTMEAGAVTSVAGAPLTAFSSSFDVAQGVLHVTALTPAAGSVSPPGDLELDIEFSAELDQAELDDADVLLLDRSSGDVLQPWAGFSYDSAAGTITASFSSLAEGAYSLYVLTSAKAVRDLDGNLLDGNGDGVPGDMFVADFGIDAPDGPFPVPLIEQRPLGHGIFGQYETDIGFHAEGDVDAFSLDVDAGQEISLRFTSTGGAGGTLLLRDPGGSVVAQTSVAQRQTGFLNGNPSGAGGLFSIELTGGGQGSGGLGLLLNACEEPESYDDVQNDTPAEATSLDALCTPGRGDARRYAVQGNLEEGDGTPVDDYFSLDLAAGDTLSVTVWGSDQWELLDSGETLSALPVTHPVRAGVSSVVGFVAEEATTVLVHLIGDGQDEETYRFVACVGAFLEDDAGDSSVTLEDVYAAHGHLDVSSYDVEPDDHAGVENLYDVVPGVTLAIDGGDPLAFGIIPVRSERATTGLRVFGWGSAGGTKHKEWTDDDWILRADFATPVSSVAIDMVPHNTGDRGSLRAFDSGGQAVATVNMPFSTVAGEVTTLVIERQYADIAYVTAGPRSGDTLTLDNLRVGLDDTDSFRFLALAGDRLVLDLSTPGAGPGEPGNTLAPVVSLHDPAGNEIPALRGEYTAPTDGEYEAMITSAEGTRGAYRIQISGQSVATEMPPYVVLSVPEDGGNTAGPPNWLELVFSDGLLHDLPGPDALAIDGGATVTAVEAVDGRTVRFLLDVPAGEGAYSYLLAADSLADLQGRGCLEFAGGFSVDMTGPKVVSDDWILFDATDSGRVVFHFNEPLDPLPLDSTDFIRIFQDPTGVSIKASKVRDFGIDGSELWIDFEGPVIAGDYMVEIEAVDIQDPAGNGFDQNEDGVSNPAEDRYLAVGTPEPPTAPNLIVTPGSVATNPVELVLGGTFQMEWDEGNAGDGDIDAAWKTQVSLSSDDQFDGSDHVLGMLRYDGVVPVAAGTPVPRTAELTVPVTAASAGMDAHLILFADALDAIDEAGETEGVIQDDNLAVLPITVLAADLTVEEVTLDPADPLLGDEVEVTWRVRNSGNLDCPAGWSCRIKLMHDVVGRATVVLANVDSTAPPLGPDAEYTQSALVTLPLDGWIAAGAAQVTVCADSGGTVTEWDDTNNEGTGDVVLSAPPSADLVLSDIEMQAAGTSGGPAWIEWTVTNEGDVIASDWTTAIRFTDQSGSRAQWNLTSPFDFAGELGPGDSVRRFGTFHVSRIAEGDHWAILTVDSLNTVFEHGAEGNNVLRSPQPISIVHGPSPNLEIIDIVTPTAAVSGEQVEFEWTVTNTGDGPTTVPSWIDQVYLSMDDVVTRHVDILAAEVLNPCYLGPGESYTSRASVLLPDGVDGPLFVAVLQSSGRMAPADRLESFNVSLAPPADLVVEDVQAPVSAFSGESVNVTWTIRNEGTGSTGFKEWQERLWMTRVARDGEEDSYELAGFTNVERLEAEGDSYQRTEYVALPRNADGLFTFHVEVDAGQTIYEHLGESNNESFDPDPVEIRFTPAPDLIVTDVPIPAPTILANRDVVFTYEVRNDGFEEIPYGEVWQDVLYLSVDDSLDTEEDRTIGRNTLRGPLAAGKSYQGSVTLNLPANAAGSYYLFVKTHDADTFFEVSRDNNTGHSIDTMVVDLPRPDLTFADTILPSTAEAGTLFSIGTVTQNLGDPILSDRWLQRLYLSKDEFLDTAGDVLLGQRWFRRFDLGTDDAHGCRCDLSMPIGTPPGDYTFILMTDATERIVESDESNNMVKKAVQVTHVYPDLVPTPLEQDTEVVAGSMALFRWLVSNVGAGPTRIGSWKDLLILSENDVLGDDDDLPMRTLQHNGGLKNTPHAQSSYHDGFGVRIPREAIGDYWVFVCTDSDDELPEGAGENNNSFMFPQQLNVTPVERVNLVPEELTAPETLVYGEPLEVSWRCRNTGGPGLHEEPIWFDSVYLSPDPVLDPGRDIHLGTVPFEDPNENSPNLGPDEFYDVSGSFPISSGTAGVFHLLLKVDNGGIVPESDEFDNVLEAPTTLTVSWPGPADLVPDEVEVPYEVFAGMELTVSYTVRNDSGDAVTARSKWSDSVYLSADDQFGPEDVLLGTYKPSVGELPGNGGTYDGEITGRAPGLAPGKYYAICRTDVYRKLHESDRDNNWAASADTIRIRYRELLPGVPTNGSLDPGEADYYRLDVPEDTTVKVELDDVTATAWNQIYAAAGRVPNRVSYDLTTLNPVSSDPYLLIPRGPAERWYIMVVGVDEESRGGYVLTADPVPLGVESITPGEVDNWMPTTVQLLGAGFVDGMTVTLVDAAGVQRDASDVRVDSAAEAYARFNLFGAPEGWHDLVVKTAAREVFSAAEAVRVIEGGEPEVEIAVIQPPSVRSGHVFPFRLAFENTGQCDGEPVLVNLHGFNTIVSLDTPLGFSEADEEFLDNFHVLLLSGEGDRMSIRPGEQGVQSLSVQVPIEYPDQSLMFINAVRWRADDDTPIEDWDAIEAALRGRGQTWVGYSTVRGLIVPFAMDGSLEDEQWEPFWGRIQPRIGSTRGDYVQFLLHVAEVLEEAGHRIVRDPRQMMIDLYRLDPEFLPCAAITGRLLDARGEPYPANSRVYAFTDAGAFLEKAGSGVTDEEGYFAIPKLSPGPYLVAVENVTFDVDRDGIPDTQMPSATLPPDGDVDVGTLYTYEIPEFPVSEQLLAATTDADGTAHLLLRTEEGLRPMWRDSDTGIWEPCDILDEAVPAEAVLAAFPDGTGTGERVLAVWARTTGNDRELAMSTATAARGGAVAWSDPVLLTDDEVADGVPDAVVLPDGRAVIAYLKEDFGTEDDSDLYYLVQDPPGARGPGNADPAPILPPVCAEILPFDDGGMGVGELSSRPLPLSPLEYAGGDRLEGDLYWQNREEEWDYRAKAEWEFGEPIGIGVKGGIDVGFKQSNTEDGCRYIGKGKAQGFLSGEVSGYELKIEGKGDMTTKYAVSACECRWGFVDLKLRSKVTVYLYIPNGLSKLLYLIPGAQPIAQAIDKITWLIMWYTPFKAEDGLSFGPNVEMVLLWDGGEKSPLREWRAPSEVQEAKVGYTISPSLKVTQDIGVEGFEGTTEFEAAMTGEISISVYVVPCLFLDNICFGITFSAKIGWLEVKKEFKYCYPSREGLPDFAKYDAERGLRGILDDAEVTVNLEPPLGTDAVYPGTLLDGGTSSDLLEDLPPALVQNSGGAFVAWGKELNPADGQIGKRIVVCGFDGSDWTTPVELPGSRGFGGYPDAGLGPRGERVVVWLHADSSEITPASSLDEVLDAREEVDVVFAVDEGRGWSETAVLAATPGVDMGLTVGPDIDGSLCAAWVTMVAEGSYDLLFSRMLEAGWSEPVVIDNDAEPMQDVHIAPVAGQTALIWSASTRATEEDFPESHLMWSREEAGGWSAVEQIVAPAPGRDARHSREDDTKPKLDPLPGFDLSIPVDCCYETVCERDMWESTKPSGVRKPFDPNEIVGPVGYGEPRWMSSDDTLSYRIFFENIAEASAPAQQVRVTSKLDPNVEPRSFRLGDFGWGGLVFSPPADSLYYRDKLDLTDSHGFLVDVFAGIDVNTSEVFWLLTTLDPATGDQPLDVDAGFLPPNIDGTEGQGFVDYRIRPGQGAATGTIVEAKATIFFDTNAPIDTPVWSNRIDAAPPTSALTAQPTARAGTYQVTWSGADDAEGTGVASYDVYVSRNGGVFKPWLQEVAQTETAFNADDGAAYSFYSRARDHVGNVEEAPPTPDSSVMDGTDAEAPVAVLVWPTDNGIADHNGAEAATLVNEPTGAIVIHLSDAGFGIDDATVLADSLDLRKDGVPLTEGADFAFAYDALRDEITLTPAPPLEDALYEVVFSASRAVIVDLGGNPLATSSLSLGIDGVGPTPHISIPAPGAEVEDDPGYVEIQWLDAGPAGIDESTLGPDDVAVTGVPITAVEDVGGGIWRYHYQPDTSDGLLPDQPLTISLGADAARDRAANPSLLVSEDYSVRLLLDVEIDLQLGWNLISFPVLPDTPTLEDIFGTRNQSIAVWTWDGVFLRLDSGDPVNTDDGYWVLVREEADPPRAATALTLSGYRPHHDPSAPTPGWNLLGPRAMPATRENAAVFQWDPVARSYRLVPAAGLPHTSAAWWFGE